MTDDERSDDVPPAKSEEKSTSIEHNQDSSVSLESDTDDSTSRAETEEEDWIDYIKRSTRESEEKMQTFNISCWIETERKLKWRVAIRVASHSGERWTKKAARGNPGLSSTAKTGRHAGRPRKRWEDDINESVRDDETEESKGNDLKNNDTRRHTDQSSKKPKKKNRKQKNMQHTDNPNPLSHNLRHTYHPTTDDQRNTTTTSMYAIYAESRNSYSGTKGTCSSTTCIVEIRFRRKHRFQGCAHQQCRDSHRRLGTAANLGRH